MESYSMAFVMAYVGIVEPFVANTVEPVGVALIHPIVF